MAEIGKQTEIGKLTVGIRLIPDDETMKVILNLLNLWQDDNPDAMVALVPGESMCEYKIIDKADYKGAKNEN